jgi:hypothetical protein
MFAPTEDGKVTESACPKPGPLSNRLSRSATGSLTAKGSQQPCGQAEEYDKCRYDYCYQVVRWVGEDEVAVSGVETIEAAQGSW